VFDTSLLGCSRRATDRPLHGLMPACGSRCPAGAHDSARSALMAARGSPLFSTWRGPWNAPYRFPCEPLPQLVQTGSAAFGVRCSSHGQSRQGAGLLRGARLDRSSPRATTTRRSSPAKPLDCFAGTFLTHNAAEMCRNLPIQAVPSMTPCGTTLAHFQANLEALCRTRTDDPFLTIQVQTSAKVGKKVGISSMFVLLQFLAKLAIACTLTWA
jgi:hypothetical protein